MKIRVSHQSYRYFAGNLHHKTLRFTRNIHLKWHILVLFAAMLLATPLFTQSCGQEAQFTVTFKNDSLHFQPAFSMSQSKTYTWTWQYASAGSGASNNYILSLPLSQTTTSLSVGLAVNTGFDIYQCARTIESNADCDPEADFDWSIGNPLPQAGCLVRFQSFPVANQLTETWDLGDGQQVNNQSLFWHNFPYAGVYSVCHTVVLQDLSDPSITYVYTCCKDVVVVDCPPPPAPNPNFTPFEIKDCCRLSMWFVPDYPGGAHSWDFGDNTTSTEVDPVHYYTNISTYSDGTPSVDVQHCVTENNITQCTTLTVSFAAEAVYVGSPGIETSLNGLVSSIDGQVLFPGNTFDNRQVNVAGELQIDKFGTDFIFDGTSFCMHPESGMRLMPSRKMTLQGGVIVNNAPFCAIWRSIDLDGTSTFTASQATIQNALYGLRTVGVGNARTVKLSDVNFYNNFIGIYANRLINVQKFDRNTFQFTGMLAPLGGLPIDPVTGASVYLPERSYAGIVISKTPFTIPNNQDAGATNGFKNLANGIMLLSANSTIRRCQFQYMIAGGYYPNGGYGIQHNDPAGGRQLLQYGLGIGQNDPLTFQYCRIAVSVINGGPNTFVRSRNNKMDVEIGYDYIIGGSLAPNFQSTSLIYNNKISFTGSHGIFAAFQSGNPSALKILSNEINVNGTGQGIWLLGTGDATQHLIEVKDNSGIGLGINVASGGQAGINLQNISGILVENNDVNLAWSEGAPKGIYMAGSSNNTLRCNYVAGGYSSPDNNDTALGLLVESSGTNTFETNHIMNTREAIRFDGQCGSTVLACNTMEEHKTGLYYTQVAVSGEQKNRGNRWLNWPTSASVSIGAQHDGIVTTSFPIINEIQPSWYYTYFNSDQTPPTIVMPNNQDPINETWFYGGTDVVCDECGEMLVTYPVNSLDTAIATGGATWSAYQNELDWWSEHYLYRKLADYPDLVSGDQMMSDFYSAMSDGILGRLTGVGRQNDSLFLFDASAEAQLQDNFNTIQEALDDIAIIDSLLTNSLSQTEIDTLLLKRTAFSDTIAERQVSNDAIWSQWVSYRGLQADTLIAANGNIGTTAAYSENEKILHDLYLKTVTKNLPPTLAQKAQIKEIAEQCPLTGGPVVYRARAWHAAITGEFLQPEICSGVSERSSATEQQTAIETTDMAVYPNPASGKVTVEYSAGKGQTLQLFNYAGTEVFRLPLAEGFNRIELNVQNLPAGLYVCKIVQGPGQILSKKVVVLK